MPRQSGRKSDDLRSSTALFEIPADTERILESLPEKKAVLWRKAVEGWLSPATRLEDLRREVESEERGVAPSYHVPSAEGVAVYQGMFGPNGALSKDDKQLVLDLVRSVIMTEPDETKS